MIQQNMLPTGSTDVFTDERKKEITDIVIPTMEATARSHGTELKDVLESNKNYPFGRLKELLSDMAGQDVFSGELPFIYEQLGVSYN